jgi:HD superfamily phosphohydrolase
MRGKLIRDAVHGDIAFSPLEMAVIDTPPVQRLRGIKQLGASHLVYPSAVHTRFEHSLGTCWLAKKLLAELAERGWTVDPEDALAVPLAALLHDVTHVPFGHTFEDERRLFDRHDEDPERLAHFLAEPTLAAALASSGVELRVRELLQRGASPLRPCARELISGTICADLLDYLRRDAFHTGLPQVYDDRVFRAFTVVDGHFTVELQKQGLLRHDVLSELIHLLRVRYNLTERVYYHHAKTIAGGMVSKALELALEAGHLTRDELYTLRDDSFLYLLAQRCVDLPGADRLLADLAARRLYKRVFVAGLRSYGADGMDEATQARLAAAYHNDAQARRAGEERLAARLGIAPEALLIYCPAPRMQLKEAAVPVRIGPDRVVSLDALDNPEVASLGRKYRGLWRITLCVSRAHEGLWARAGELASEEFGVANQVRGM